MKALLYCKWSVCWVNSIAAIAVKAILLTGFMLGYLSVWAQTAQQDCTTLKFGDFVMGNPKDSIYVYREFGTWYEVDAKAGRSNIFEIVWIDDCHFALVFKSALAKAGTIYKWRENDTLHYTVSSTTPTSINFTVTDKWGKYQQTLARQDGLDVWAILLNTVKDVPSAYNSIKALLADSSKNTLSQFKQFQAASFDQAAIAQVEYILSLLKKGEITKMNDVALAGFKQLMTATVLADYSLYVHNSYGKLLSYSIVSVPLNMNVGNLLGVTMSEVKQYVLTGNFEKIKGPATITIKLQRDSMYKIYDFSIEAANETVVPFIDSLTNNFWKKLKSKSFKAIYNDMSQLFKDKATYEQAKGLLSLIEGYGLLDFYKQSEQHFAVIQGIAFIRVQYYLNTGDKKALIKFLYVNDKGIYKIASIKYSKQ